jgi:hypothetical protein
VLYAAVLMLRSALVREPRPARFAT